MKIRDKCEPDFSFPNMFWKDPDRRLRWQSKGQLKRAATVSFEKVFGIGLNKTGTTTLGDMLGQFGLRHRDWSPVNFALYQQGCIDQLLNKNQRFDSFTDWPWPLIVKELIDFHGDRACYILTRRASSQVWLDSLKGHALATKPGHHARRVVYGYEYPQENEPAHLKIYHDHLDKVRQLFSDNKLEHALLDVCWEEGDGWEEVAGFLNKTAPDQMLPHHNSKLSRPKNLPYKAANLQRLGSLVAH